VIGILHAKYVLLEGDEGLVLLEPRAARERVVYEQILAQASKGDIDSQGLLVPEVLDLDSHDLDVVMSNQENFEEAGISIEPFGGGSIQVRSLPSLIKVTKPRELITKLIDELVETQGASKGKKITFQVFAETIARRVSRYEPADISRVEGVLDEMFKCDLPYCTPKGAPTLIQISLKELEKKFKG